MSSTLSTQNHSRDSAGLKYVYPVLSRRAGGVSIGINVNTDNACNWQCVYCQVPNLTIGSAPAIDFDLLETELRSLLDSIKDGSFFERYELPIEQRSIKDIAVSGNGEPTSAKEFEGLIELIGNIRQDSGIQPLPNFVVISNGSLVHLPQVQKGLQALHRFGGELWFKIDSATVEGRQRINRTRLSQRQLLTNLRLAMSLCRTKIQTCIVNYQGQSRSLAEQSAYLELLQQLEDIANKPAVMLYTLARPSMQADIETLEAVGFDVLERLAESIRHLGFIVEVAK